MKSGGEQGEVKFTRPGQDEVVSWLKGVKWHDSDVNKALIKECSDV